MSFTRTLARLCGLAGGLFGLLILLQLGAHWAARAATPGMRISVAVMSELLVCLLMLLAYRLGVRAIERRPVDELSAHCGRWLLAAGLLIGMGLFCLVYALLFAIGIAHVAGFGVASGLAGAAAAAAAAAVGEEIVFRGALFRIVEEQWGTLVALVISAVLFGAVHALNPGATVISTVAIALEAGVLLAAAYSAARTLWFPIGIHCGWNFTEGGIFGTPVSGGHAAGLLKVSLNGPTLLTGGLFGPEASLVSIVVCLVAAGLLIGVALRRGAWHA